MTLRTIETMKTVMDLPEKVTEADLRDLVELAFNNALCEIQESLYKSFNEPVDGGWAGIYFSDDENIEPILNKLVDYCKYELMVRALDVYK
jgi:hypothetical protein